MNTDNATREFICTYEFDGAQWSTHVWASTHEEAEMKLKAMANGRVDGVVVEKHDCGDPNEIEEVDFIPMNNEACPTCGRGFNAA